MEPDKLMWKSVDKNTETTDFNNRQRGMIYVKACRTQATDSQKEHWIALFRDSSGELIATGSGFTPTIAAMDACKDAGIRVW